MASYLSETNLLEKFKDCFEEEILTNVYFQEKLLQLSSLEYSNSQGRMNELLLKKMIECNNEFTDSLQLNEMKNTLFTKFLKILNGSNVIQKDDSITELTRL